MKKIISLISTVALVASAGVTPVARATSFSDILKGDSREEAIAHLSQLGIISGYDDGSYHPDEHVTRAEFTKMVICMIDAEDEALTTGYASGYADVPQGEWYVPYINYAAKYGIITGYANGTFGPNNEINYAEASTILLRVMGYSESDLGSFWPNNYVNKANSIPLANAPVGDSYAILARGTAAVMMDTALLAEVNPDAGAMSANGASDNTASGGISDISYQRGSTLLECIGYTITEDVTVISSSAEDSTIGDDKIYVKIGNNLQKYNVGDSNIRDYVGQRGQLCVDDDDTDTVLFFVPTANYNVVTYSVTNTIADDIILDGNILDLNDSFTVYYDSQANTYSGVVEKASAGDSFKVVYNKYGTAEFGILVDNGTSYSASSIFDTYAVYYVLNDAVICYSNGSMTELTVSDTTKCYKDNSSQSSNFSAIKGDLEMGDVLYVKRDGNSIDYITYTKGNLQGPIQVATDGSAAGFDTNASTKFMRDGVASSASAFMANDIIYYSTEMNMVFAYSKKITGVYEAATPSKDTPTSVTISGVTYEIEGVNAFNKLSSSGPFKLGDTVTICLGKDGKKVAGVVTDSSSASSSVTIGFAVSSDQKQFTKADGVSYTSYYVTVVKTDGSTEDFPVSTNPQTYYVGKVVKATQSGGDIAQVTALNESGTVSGVVDSDLMKIGAYNVSEDCEILDIAKMQYLDSSLGRTSYASSYRRIYLQRLNGLTIASSKVLYYTTDSTGKINKMILDNVSGDAYQYGIITKKTTTQQGDSTSIDLSIYENGAISSYDYYLSSLSALHQPVEFISSDKTVYGVAALKQYTNIKSLTTAAAVSSTGTQYKLSDKVVCYEQIAEDSYVQVTINDIIDGSYKTIGAYYDKAEDDGGRVRIVIVK